LKAGERSDARRKDGLRTRTAGSLFAFEKHQRLIHRHAPAFIRDVLDTFRQRKLTAIQAADQLGVSPSRLYALATVYLRVRAKNQGPLWPPGHSGGNHAAPRRRALVFPFWPPASGFGMLRHHV
jgi:hypothetical protein